LVLIEYLQCFMMLFLLFTFDVQQANIAL